MVERKKGSLSHSSIIIISIIQATAFECDHFECVGKVYIDYPRTNIE